MYNSNFDEAEFSRQLAEQQKGMNELSLQEYLDNRQKYLDQGRALESNAAQQAARKEALTDKKVNSSIGSQWRYRIDEVDKQVKNATKNMSDIEKKTTKMNVKLKYKR